jgi:hypothetical protein
MEDCIFIKGPEGTGIQNFIPALFLRQNNKGKVDMGHRNLKEYEPEWLNKNHIKKFGDYGMHVCEACRWFGESKRRTILHGAEVAAHYKTQYHKNNVKYKESGLIHLCKDNLIKNNPLRIEI